MFARILGREPDRSAAPMEAESVRRLVDDILFIDVEADRRGRLHSVGAVRGEQRFRWDAADGPPALHGLDRLAEGVRWIAGHNILAHDLPVLRDRAPALRLLGLPALDTLILSPLAFPANPYHRLVKDYKLVGDAVNDPVADADLSRELLSETMEVFARMVRAGDPTVTFHRFALSAGGRGGMADLLGLLGVPVESTLHGALAVWKRAVAGRVCGTALARTAEGDIDPADARLAFAYALAWVGVAGANSVLPGWVRASFPAVVRLVEGLRDTACDDPDCAWCRIAFDALHWLGQTFGYPAYRAEPAADDGGSLQQRIVEAGLNGRPLLAVLPTGGGKSLCFQVPAIARYHRTGALTVVVSPLQALMKDQVDNLEVKTGRQAADALYSTLTLPERGAVMDRVRLGDTAILYVSPEQLRNPSVRRTLEQRSIGCWVFDEAHCLSNWGHDFRPDYLFVARFVREMAERQGVAPPPVACFTATARHEVVAEIRRHFKDELAQDLLLFDGGVERPNLSYRVEAVSLTDKVGRIAELLGEHLQRGDSTSVAIVYAATRRRTEELRDALGDLGFTCAAFHAGLRAPVKHQIQFDFVTGAVRVVVATNAFGMGIDKDTVRLVVHAEVPGSIEAYLQEAGRAGRDRDPATCVLLYDPADLETQFRLAARSELSQQDMAQILRGVRKLAGRLKATEVVATTGELIADPDLALGFRPEDQDADTRVKTALAWLERAGLLQRDENRTWVVSARPRVFSVADAARIIAAQTLPEARARQWMAIFRILATAAGETGEERSLTIDELARSDALRYEIAGLPPQEAARRILSIIGQMAQAGLVDRGTALTAQVRASGSNATRRVLERVGAMAGTLLDLLRAEAPDGDDVVLAPRGAAQKLRDLGHADAQPDSVRILLKVLTQKERGQAGTVPRLKLTRGMLGHWRLRPAGPWGDLAESLKRRLAVAAVVVERLLAVAKEAETGGSLLIPFTLEDLAEAVRRDLTLAGAIHDPLDAVTGACLLLHDARAIVLQNGLSVFRQGLTLRLPAEAKGRRYGKADHQRLADHYEARTRQIHAMGEYARLGLRDPQRARAFAADYFAQPTDRLLARHFPGRRIELSRPVARETYDAIVTALDNPVQQAIVTAPPDQNLLVLAGPGSGKTRVVVHRCAYLLRVKRVPAKAILVVCFNRSAALAVRRRLFDLIGDEAAQVDVNTYHALAMRLVGVTFAERSERMDAQFNAVIADATALLRGERPFPGLDPEEVRERLLARYRYILIDEYQDIDPNQYDLISAIAGRQESDPDARIALMAVGDDDQGVYGFRGASVEFIRRFHADYGAEARYLVENYRSTRAILSAAGVVIAANSDRMKHDRPVEVDRRRRADPPGEPVRVLAVGGEGAQISAALAEVRARAAAAGGWERVAVLGRTRTELAPFHALCDRIGIPADPAYDDDTATAFPLHRLREMRVMLDRLARSDGRRLRPGALRRWIARLRRLRPSPWWSLADRIVAEVAEQTGAGRVPVSVLREQIHESLAQLRRDRASGRGVYIGTLHGVKGLEFDHVVILDGGFERRHDKHDPEEERRLFYVGMTRARRSLCLLSRADLRHPHLPLLAGQPVERAMGTAMDADAAAVLRLQRRILGLGDLDIGFAGRQPPGNRIHRELGRLSPGDPLFFDAEEGGRVFLRTASGTAVAVVASAKRDFWYATAKAVERVSVLAVVQRFRTDGTRDYCDRSKSDQWEIPVVEVWTRTVR